MDWVVRQVVLYFEEGQFPASYTRAEGLGQGLVKAPSAGSVWGAL